MRILHLITPRRFSGAERVCGGICADLQERGHDVLVVTRPLPDFEAYLAECGVPFQAARISNKFDFSRPLAIGRLIRSYRADLVHTHLSTATQWGMISAHFAGVPCVAHVHAMNRAIWYIWATRVIAVAGAVRDHLVRQGLPAERISVVYNAVEVDHLPEVDAACVRAALGVAPEAPTIATAAHLSQKKGLHVLLEALAIVRERTPDVRCLLMGEGGYRGRLEAQARELGLECNVSFLGYRPDAREIMAAADVVCLPSVTGEGLPVSVLEASTRRRPVVATRLAGLAEAVVDGETGFLVAPGSAEELADRLGALLADPELRQRMGQAGRELVCRRFSADTRTAQIEEVYRLALESKAIAARRSRARN